MEASTTVWVKNEPEWVPLISEYTTDDGTTFAMLISSVTIYMSIEQLIRLGMSCITTASESTLRNALNVAKLPEGTKQEVAECPER